MSDSIIIRGAREHNLKNIDVAIPRDKFVCITGLSGSGKSSLAFDTIYAEGQRRYVESLSAYARQFLGQMDKPDLDSIDGLSPAVSIDQRTTSKNPRSTVGTVTEIYDYLRLLFARIGIPHCPECGREIKRQTTDQVADKILERASEMDNKRALILAPIVRGRKGEFDKLLEGLRKEGFARVRIDGEVRSLSEDISLDKKFKHNIDVVVDRLVLEKTSNTRLSEAIETATRLAEGNVVVHFIAEPGVATGASAGVATGSSAVVTAAATDAPTTATTAETPAFSSGAPTATPAAAITTPPAAAITTPTAFSTGATAAAENKDEETFSLALACPIHGHSLNELEPRDFSFNTPFGACPECLGLGYKNEVDPHLIIPNPSLSLAEGAYQVVNAGSNYLPQVFSAVAQYLGVDIDTPWEDYSPDVRKAFMEGLGQSRIRIDYVTRDGRDTHWTLRWEGLLEYTMQRYRDTASEGMRLKLEEYLSITPCKACGGARLKPEILAVTVGGLNIHEVTLHSASQSLHFFEGLMQTLDERELHIGGRIIKEISERLRFLVDVGLDYLTLERGTASLSGGEAQRIRLATQIGAGLMGVLYILDEPSIGLHQRDNARLIATLKRLRDLGNTVIVVEHDEETIRSADHIIDIGPGAGEMGGYIVAQGTVEDILTTPESLTGDYLSGRRKIPVPQKRRSPEGGIDVPGNALRIEGVSENNLRSVDVAIPFGTLTVVTGVSGSGKSSLITDTLAPALTNRIHHAHKRVGSYLRLTGLDRIDKVIDIDQSPIGRTPRSNPATYVGLWDDIRSLYSSMPESRARGYSPGRFSFNVSGGRCEACKGDGQLKIEMHFLPDIYVPCEVCHGSRYNRETLQVTYRGKSVADVLNMSVDEALHFFENIPPLARKLQTLYDVGLGYIKLGQPATTLSGGEAQRVKLASELQRKQTGKTFYILDEPTTGLHFDDVRQLLEVLQRLVGYGNTVLVIEHNLDIIKSADYIIDLGPEGGDRGGEVIAAGTPEEVALNPRSYTGQYLKHILPLSS